MNIEAVYKIRKTILFMVSVCSLLIFLLFSGLMRHFFRITRDNYAPFAFKSAALFIIIILAALAVRFLVLKFAVMKDPSQRDAIEDERVRANWLLAFHMAFWTMIGTHIIYGLFLNLGFFDIHEFLFNFGLAHVVWLNTGIGLMTLFGSVIFLDVKRPPIKNHPTLVMKQGSLLIVFLCGSVSSALFLYPAIYSYFHVMAPIPYLKYCEGVGMTLLLFIGVFLSWRYLFFAMRSRSRFSKGGIFNDERAVHNRHRAERASFFIMLIFQFANMGLKFYSRMYDLPYFSQITMSIAAVTTTGFFLFYNREKAQ